MKRLVLALTLAACGGRTPMTELSAPDAPEQVTTLRSGLSSPVVAVDDDGRRYLAAIDEATGWPTFIEPDGRQVPFPGGAPGGSADLAMVLGPDDLLHAVWTTGSALYYARVHPDDAGRSESVQRLQAERASAPTLAVSEYGDVLILFVDGFYSRTPDKVVASFSGSVERGFSGPTTVMPECCETWTGRAWDVSIGTIRFDRSLASFGYSWSDDAGGWSAYVSQGRGFYEQGRVPSTRYAGHAGIVGPPMFSSLFTLSASNDALAMTTLGRAPESETVLEAEGLDTLQVAQDEAGQAHVVVSDRRQLHYLRRMTRGDWMKHRAVAVGDGASIQLTPRAGGLVVTASRMYIPYTVLDENGQLAGIEVYEARTAQ